MDLPDAAAIAATTRLVLLATFALAFAFGLIAQRSGFCTMGAVSDLVAFGDTTRLRQWALAIGVAVVGTHALAAAGAIDLAGSFYTGPRFTPLAYVVGGLLFGIGMVLAGGCGARSLVRAGSGSLKSLIALLVLGLVAYLTLRGVLAMPRAQWLEAAALELRPGQSLPALLAAATGSPADRWLLPLGLGLGGALVAWALAARELRRVEPLLAGAGIGAIVVAMWWVSGYLGFVAEHPDTLEPAYLGTASRRMEALSFVAPVAQLLDWLMFFTDRGRAASLGAVAVLGMLAGAMAGALASRRFRWEGFRDTEDTANHLVGGALMGFGGVTAMGCTIGQGLSGASTLSAGSLLALVSIVAGAALGVRYQAWRLERIDASS